MRPRYWGRKMIGRDCTIKLGVGSSMHLVYPLKTTTTEYRLLITIFFDHAQWLYILPNRDIR